MDVIYQIESFDDCAIESILNLSSAMINNNYDGMTLLSYAIKHGNSDMVALLLECGADPNGITPDGYTIESPISLAYNIDDFDTMKRVITMILKNGGDINLGSISKNTLLFNLINQECNNLYEKVKFVLSRGANPNGSKDKPIFLTMFLKYVETNLETNFMYNDKLNEQKKILDVLIYFGADIHFCNLHGISAFSTMKDLNIDIKFDNRELVLKRLKVMNYDEVTVNWMIENFSKLNFEKIKNIRYKKFGYEKYSNITTFSGTDLSEFIPSELVELVEDNKIWAFHVSEIPLLLKNRKTLIQLKS